MTKYIAPVFGVLLGVLTMANPVGAVTTTCADRLWGHDYTCTVKGVLGDSVTGLSFSSPPAFQVTVGGVTELGCACDTDGSFKSPKFNHSPSRWTCAGIADPDSTLTIRGAVAGNGKISQVEGLFTDEGKAFPILYDCDLGSPPTD